MSKPAVIIVGADKGGVGKTTVTRTLLDYFSARKVPTRAFDTEAPKVSLEGPPALTNAQKLAKALKVCHKLPRKTHAQKKKRAKCEAQAKKKYGAKKASKAKRSTRRSK